jgi:hypothetical protein
LSLPTTNQIKFRTSQEEAIVRLAARGRGLPLAEFLRIAALRAACDMTSGFSAPGVTTPGATVDTPGDGLLQDWDEPGAAEILVAKVQWDAEIGFQRTPVRPRHVDARASDSEQASLIEFRRILGAVVHGRAHESIIGFHLTDWLRKNAWLIKSNRTPRRSGLSHVPIPNGGATIKNGTIHLAVGPITAKVTMGKIVRQKYPSDGVLFDALVSQITGGRWRIAFSAVMESATQKKAQPTREGLVAR